MPVGFQNPKTAAALSRGTCVAEFRESDPDCVEIGLVNNMPVQAMEATERQFRALLDAASERIGVRLSFYALPDVPRSDEGRDRIGSVYSEIRELWNGRLDGVIVTGAEPVAKNLAGEPFWGNLTTLTDWAEQNTYSSIFSCLAAHAAVLHIDGINRRPLESKLSGVYDSTSMPGNPLTAGIPAQICMPHSRWNDIPETSLAECGYRMLTRSAEAGVDAFVKHRQSLFVFIQGHPEYDADSLLLEYRRDIRRFLRGERDAYPRMPGNYFDENDAALFTALRERALAERCEGLLADFPAIAVAARLKATWRPAANRLYRNWLLHLCGQKSKALRGTRRRVEAGRFDAVSQTCTAKGESA